MNKESDSIQKFTVFVGGLNFQTSDSNLRDFFLSSPKINGIENVRICRRIEGTSKGFGYVTFNNKSSFHQSLTLNGSLLDGKNIRIEPDHGKKMIFSNKKSEDKSSNSYSSSDSSPVIKKKSNPLHVSSNSSSYSSSYSYSSQSSSSYSSYSSESDKKEKKHHKNRRKSKKRKQRNYSDYSYSS